MYIFLKSKQKKNDNLKIVYSLFKPLTFTINKKRAHECVLSFNGTPEGIRTPDLLVRSQTLYPAELPAHNSFYCPNIIPLQIEKVNSFFVICTRFIVFSKTHLLLMFS